MTDPLYLGTESPMNFKGTSARLSRRQLMPDARDFGQMYRHGHGLDMHSLHQVTHIGGEPS